MSLQNYKSCSKINVYNQWDFKMSFINIISKILYGNEPLKILDIFITIGNYDEVVFKQLPFDRRPLIIEADCMLYDNRDLFDNPIKRIDAINSIIKRKILSVQGNFQCDWVNLNTLENCPTQVKGSYSIRHNKLTSFKGIPKEINGNLCIEGNKILSFDYAPRKIHGNLNVSRNKISSLENIPEYIGNSLILDSNPITSLIGIHKKILKCVSISLYDLNIESGGLGLLFIEWLKCLNIIEYHAKLLADESKSQLEIVRNHINNGGTPSSFIEYNNQQKLRKYKMIRFLIITEKYLGKGKNGVLACQQELIDEGLEEYAVL